MARRGLNKEVIISTAVEIANSDGIENISIKSIAERLKVKPPSIYNHVDGYKDLMNELALYSMEQLGEVLVVAAVGKSGDGALRSMCNAYLQYALDNHGIYELTQSYNQWADKKAIKATEKVLFVVREVLDIYELNDDDFQHTVRIFRSMLHGFASIVIHGGFGHPLPLHDSFEKAIELLIISLPKVLGDKNEKA